MTETQWPLERDMAAFYGDPDADRDGKPSAAWESSNLVYVPSPWAMWIALDNGPQAVTRLRVHRLVAPALTRAFAAIKEEFPSQAQIEAIGLHWTAGAYHFRKKRQSNDMSTHAFGAAIDLDPARNKLGVPWRRNAGMMDLRVVAAFEREGATWGGRFRSRPDCMHFQWAR